MRSSEWHFRKKPLAVVVPVVTLLVLSMSPARSEATVLPANDLWKQDNRSVIAAISRQQFDATLNTISARYAPVFAQFGARLVILRFWDNPTVNAVAGRGGSDWMIAMFGGLARRPEVTVDGFTLVACHEIGHHLGGYPFYADSWAATEGEADTYAVQACGRFMWRDDPANADIARSAPQPVRRRCEASWADVADRNLCARIAMAGKSLADLLGALEDRTVDYDTPDRSVVAQTVSTHPPAQCRLDGYLQAAQCGVAFDFTTIPGVGEPFGANSLHAEVSAAAVSCMPISVVMETPGYNGHDRPLCWFAPKRPSVSNRLAGPDGTPDSTQNRCGDDRIDAESCSGSQGAAFNNELGCINFTEYAYARTRALAPLCSARAPDLVGFCFCQRLR